MLRQRLRQAKDEGFSLVELVVAMVMLALIMIAMANLLLASLKVVSKNNTRATATELATQRVENVRVASVTGDCTNVKAALEAVTTTADGRGVPLTVKGEILTVSGREDCVQTTTPASDDPELIRIKVTVTTTSPGFNNPVATVQTDIYVKKNTT